MSGEVCFRFAVIGDDSLQEWLRIGSGGFGEIYRAQHRRWGTDVAIKLLLYRDGSTSSIQREANLMFQARNPNVIRVYGLYEGRLGDPQLPPQSGLVMDFMARGSLADLLQKMAGSPPWPLAFRMAHQISLGMNFLHQSSPPVLHLDLKPSNVLLSDSLHVKASPDPLNNPLWITDFGLSRVTRSASAGVKEEDVGGTLSYMPPEALESLHYTANKAHDVYSYGVLLWSIVTGKEPYSNALSSLVRFRIPLGDRPDLTSIDRAETEGLEDAVQLMTECWAQDPYSRPSFLGCVQATARIYDMHKQGLNDAVHHVLKELDHEICSALKCLQISRKTQSDVCPPSVSCLTGPSLPTQETPPSYTQTPKKESCPHVAPVTSERTPQRQMSTPGGSGVHISLSNVCGLQIGNNNTMNVVQRPRQRHQTAPAPYSHADNAQRKPQ